MASLFHCECLQIIFLYLYDTSTDNLNANISTEDIYSCTLVSRHWCRISTPLLYAYPFQHFRHLMHPLFYHNIPDLSSPYFKLVRTLLSCIPRSEVERIISPGSSDEQNLFPDLSEEFFSSNPMFNYITFIRGIIFDDLLYLYSGSGIKIHEWLSSNISNNATRDQISKSFLVTNHLINFLCAYCSNYLQKLEFSFTVSNSEEYFINIINQLTFNNEQSGLTNLKELYYCNYYNIKKVDLYSAFSNSVRNLTLLYNEGNNTSEKANSLSRFISLQNNLQHILLSENSIGFTLDNHISGFYNVVFESLSTQSESLRTLKLKNIPFNKLNGEALNSLCLLKNIRVLELYNCIRIDDNDDNLKEWAENLTRLEVFELVSQHIRDVSEGFLIQLIQSSSSTLNKLTIRSRRENRYHRSLFQQIPVHLNSLIHLDVTKIYLDELILIFKSCTQLVYLSIILSDDELWGTKFKDLGELIPRKLQKIRIKRMDDLLFSSSELKCFFEGCVNNNGKLKYLEIHDGECEFDQEYFDVADEFGIQIIDD
ncbi:hypothetical protein RhiirA5_410421 [Rhizophagus irregularis]|uniref:Uncharacterized protein n=2 Tax=Rhizophagus irregularis TaxID=588596 RepID=A0A2N0Q3F2_9GLOM|nr:hypothetical protein RhiirA5_410421 [Rhizophagus irregularis]CAB4481335.1 unnamed protein product [Rhizophagus irregularis]CAB5383183.1 unnamed protein product [Rhizophagus irregularis]